MSPKKAILVLALVVFLLIGSLGVFHFGMTNMNGDSMSRCPFMGMTAICQMTPLEHIAAWQSMFTSLPGFKSIMALFLILLALLLSLTWINKIPIRPRREPRIIRYRRSDYTPSQNPLQELFSSGILNPKLF